MINILEKYNRLTDEEKEDLEDLYIIHQLYKQLEELEELRLDFIISPIAMPAPS